MTGDSIWLKLSTATSLVFTVTMAVIAYREGPAVHAVALSYCPEGGCHPDPGKGEEQWVSLVFEACHGNAHTEVCVYSWTMAYVYRNIAYIITLFLIAIAMPVVMYVGEEIYHWWTTRNAKQPEELIAPDGPDSIA